VVISQLHTQKRNIVIHQRTHH